MFNTPRFLDTTLYFTSKKADKKFVKTYFDPAPKSTDYFVSGWNDPIFDEPKPSEDEIETARECLKKLGLI